MSPSQDTAFKREVSETLLRCKKMGFDQNNAIIELNGLKIAEDKTFADCARYLFTTILGEGQHSTVLPALRAAASTLSAISCCTHQHARVHMIRSSGACAGLCLPAAPSVRGEYCNLYPESAPDVSSKEGKAELMQRLRAQLQEWGALLQRFARNDDDQVRTDTSVFSNRLG